MEAIQYVTDAHGAKTSVIIPMKRVFHLSEIIEELARLEQIAQSVRNGIREAKAIEAGKAVGISAKDFLDEL